VVRALEGDLWIISFAGELDVADDVEDEPDVESIE
jgi:hypothetical protein